MTEFLLLVGTYTRREPHVAGNAEGIYTYRFNTDDGVFEVGYQPAESRDGLFGGNSNWRGPVWMPLNFLIIEGLQRFHHYYGDDFTVECPTGSGVWMTLDEVVVDLSARLIAIFRQDGQGRRPVHGNRAQLQSDPQWRDHLLFYEYFHGEHGAGLGASHQTGWTGLIAKLLQQSGGRG